MRRALRFGAGTALGGGLSYAGYKHQTDEGFRRACTLYGCIGPVVVQYRWVEWKQEHLTSSQSQKRKTAEWRALDETHAARVVHTLEKLQGMYTKYGQTAAGMNNTFSHIWIEQLRRLEDQVTPRSKEVVMQTILEETGMPASATFATFDDVPLGSASIGQVHRATLRSTGAEVAVKVQYPDARQVFRTDMATIKGFFTWAAPEQLVTLQELERNFEDEFNYKTEAANLVEVGANMRKHGFSPREVVVPQPHSHLCTERLLVMELVSGCKLVDGLRRYGEIVAAKEGKTLADLEAEIREDIERNGVPPRYDGPSAKKIAMYNRYLNLRDAAVNLLIGIFNCTVGLATGARLSYHQTSLPPNAPRLMDTLMRVHGTQLLVDGVFNADTHAGNFLLTPDERIALIDYGATKRLVQNERLSACCLYAALARGDEEKLLQLAVAGGYKSKYLRKDVITKLTRFGFDTMGSDLLGNKNAAQFMDELKAADPYEEVADNLVMASFMSFRMRVVALALNHPVVCSDWWGEIAEAELTRAGLPYEEWTPELMRKVNENVVRVVKSGMA